jgi:hypothetical protein
VTEFSEPPRRDPEYLERRLKLVLEAIEQTARAVRQVLDDITDGDHDGAPDL